MTKILNDVVIEVASINGSGSQSSNNILLRSLFRMGIPVGGKNLFPSNIAGLPTWFTIRANRNGFTARRDFADVFVALNPDTITTDIQRVADGGVFIYNSDIKFNLESLNSKCLSIPVSFKALVAQVTDSIKLKKLLANMVYVGILAHLLKIDEECLQSSIRDQFKGKEKVLDVNFKAIQVGEEFARTMLSEIAFPFQVERMQANTGKLLIDGNTAGGLGMVMGGCTFMSWYPITPSSSLAENFQGYAQQFRQNKDGTYNVAVVQAEDELSAIAMVLGAGWAGARAMTTTSGPGLSLMNEAAGLFYFAEVPGVLWDVQRMGPSTGLPTRTAQSDLISAAFLSHGDTKQVLLLPGNVEECFEFGQTSLDLAERLQTLVIVLSDLDLGMNYWISDEFKYPTKELDRGKVLNAEQLLTVENFQRYKDVDGDGIPYRTLPGTKNDKAAYFTRGSGHNEKGQYTEDPLNHHRLLDRLARKFQTAKSMVPRPIVDQTSGTRVGLVAFGSTDSAINETRFLLTEQGVTTSYMRVRAYPFNDDVLDFLSLHSVIYVIEQNRDGQLRSLLTLEYPHLAMRLRSVLSYDGLPVSAWRTSHNILEQEAAIQEVAR